MLVGLCDAGSAHGGVWCSIGQALARTCCTASALRSGKRARLLAAAVTARQARSVLGVCKPGRCRARSSCAFGCWLRWCGIACYTQRSKSNAAESFRTAAGFLRRRRADFWRHSATPPVGIVYMRYGRAAGSHLSHGAQNLNFPRSFWNPFETRPNSTSSC